MQTTSAGGAVISCGTRRRVECPSGCGFAVEGDEQDVVQSAIAHAWQRHELELSPHGILSSSSRNGRDALDALSAAESRVARAVAAGLTNQQVAESLFISPRTVDYHLRSVYRKLHIDSRVQLVIVVMGGTVRTSS